MDRGEPEPIRVLYVDDETEALESVRRVLEHDHDGLTVVTGSSAREGLDRLAEERGRVDCVVSDYDMPGMDGLAFLEEIREKYPDLPFILLTGKGSEEVASEAIGSGVWDYLQKGAGSNRYAGLANRIENAVDHARARHRAEALGRINEIIRKTLQEVVSASTREGIERAVCERLVETPPFRGAWIGAPVPGSGEIIPRTTAGTADATPGPPVAVDGSPLGVHAGQPDTVDAVRDLGTVLDRPGRDEAVADHGSESSISLPLVHDGTAYGVLVIYADREDAFDDSERAVLEELTHAVAQAIAAAETRAELEEREAALARRRDELETLDRINALIQELVRALLETPTRAGIERTVCERLGASDLYQFAWIGERDPAGGVQRRAGEEIERITGDGDCVLTEPVETGELAVVTSFRDDTGVPADLQRRALDCGLLSAIAVPISYGPAVYGLLLVAADRPDAFNEREQAGFAVLGETIGFAVHAAQNQKLLLADRVVELEFRVTDTEAFFVALSDRLSCSCTLEWVVPTESGRLTHYFSVEGAPAGHVLQRARDAGQIDDVTLLSETGDGFLLEVRMDRSIPRTIVEAGASVTALDAESGTARVVAEAPPDADIRAVVDAVRSAYPESELVRKQDVDRDVQTARDFRQTLDGRLTDRQRRALRAAYFAGYYDWPRERTAEEVAESLDVSSATLHYHLRMAQQELLGAFFDEHPS